MMNRAISKDGTSIAYERLGRGAGGDHGNRRAGRRLGERAARAGTGEALHRLQLRPSRPWRQR